MAAESSDLDNRLLNLGNSPLSFEMARNVLLHPENRHKAFTEVPYFHPVGGQAYLFQSTLPLCKVHARFDPFKFLYLGKGFNKEFAILKRYYHLKHNKTELDKNLYSFQRHIYCLAIDECDSDSVTVYLVHYFGNDHLLEDAPYRKGAIIHNELPRKKVAYSIETNYDAVESFADRPSESEDPYVPVPSGHTTENESDYANMEYVPEDHTIHSARKRKLIQTPPSTYKNKQKRIEPNQSPSNSLEMTTMHALKAIQSPDYLFAMNMASQLQQLPKELKAKVKFQIATVFYEAEMKALNCTLDDD